MGYHVMFIDGIYPLFYLQLLFLVKLAVSSAKETTFFVHVAIYFIVVLDSVPPSSSLDADCE